MMHNRQTSFASVASSTAGSKTSAKTSRPISTTKKNKKKQPNRQKNFKILWKFLNQDDIDEQSMIDITADPRVFGMKYELRQGIMAMPLTWICAKRPSFQLCKQIHVTWPDAISSTPFPLHYACKYGASLLVIQYLQEQFPQALQLTDDDGNLPIHHACNATQLWNGGGFTDDDVSTTSSRKRNKKQQCVAETIKQDGIDEERNDDMAKVLRYLISRYPTGARTRNKDGNMPLHLLCKSSVNCDFETVFLILSKYPQAVNVINKNGQLPEELLSLDKKKSPPDHVLELFHYVQTNLDERQCGLPLSRFALEWDLCHRELVQEYAANSTRTHVIQAGILANQQMACLRKLRQFYPSRNELQKMEQHSDIARELRMKYHLDKRNVAWQNEQEIQDSETIPKLIQRRIDMLESKLDNINKELVGAPPFRKLQLSNDKAKLKIELHVEHVIYKKVFGKPALTKQPSSTTVGTAETDGASTISTMTSPDYYRESSEDARSTTTDIDLYDNLRLTARKKRTKKLLKCRSKASFPVLFRCMQEQNARVDFAVQRP